MARQSMRDGSEKPVQHRALRARGSDMDPIGELLYGPAANGRPHQRPDRCRTRLRAAILPFEDSSGAHEGVHRCADGRRHVLPLCACARPAVQLSGGGCGQGGEQVCPKIGYPKTIRVDQGSEFVSRDFDLWAYAKGVTLDFSRPGKPTDNAYIEAFNGRFRAERLNAHWFLTLADAAEKLEDWRRYYNPVS